MRKGYNDLGKKGNGCDKAFYWDGKDRDGWLNFKEQSVILAELASRSKLGKVKDVIPEIDQERTPPVLADGTKAIGYYIQRVNLGMTIKPQMNVFDVLKNVKKEMGSLKGKEKIAALKKSLEFMLENCSVICNEVGEFTFGIDKDSGKAYLLDLAKTNGMAGSADQADKAKIGLKNMIKHLDTSVVG
jgi:hypothetical protein